VSERDETPIGDDVPIEALQQELEEIVARLEQGDVGVDEAIALWRRGEALYRTCARRLDAAELRIEELTGSDGDTTSDSGPTTL
jgi:exodeoxyribonuclease VII small subunit